MTLPELQEIMVECGLIAIDKLQWSRGQFIHVDEFIEGDCAGMMQFVEVIEKRQQERIACLVEQMGIEGYGTLAIAAAIRKGETDEHRTDQ